MEISIPMGADMREECRVKAEVLQYTKMNQVVHPLSSTISHCQPIDIVKYAAKVHVEP